MLQRNTKGFTALELAIIIVIMGILAAIAIPRYINMTAKAKKSKAESALGYLRSGITIYYANQAVTTGTSAFPPYDSLFIPGVGISHSIPKNPYQSDLNAPDSIVIGVTKGEIVGTRGGWAYKQSTGEIWLNTNTDGVGESGW